MLRELPLAEGAREKAALVAVALHVDHESAIEPGGGEDHGYDEVLFSRPHRQPPAKVVVEQAGLLELVHRGLCAGTACPVNWSRVSPLRA